MEKLIISRHGACDDHTLELTSFGREQMRALAEAIREELNGSASAYLVCSFAMRAVKSMEILAHALDLQYAEPTRDLYSNIEMRPRHGTILNLVSSLSRYDYVILVTHFEVAEEFPQVFGESVLQTNIPSIELRTGQARVIDCKHKTAHIIPKQVSSEASESEESCPFF